MSTSLIEFAVVASFMASFVGSALYDLCRYLIRQRSQRASTAKPPNNVVAPGQRPTREPIGFAPMGTRFRRVGNRGDRVGMGKSKSVTTNPNRKENQ